MYGLLKFGFISYTNRFVVNLISVIYTENLQLCQLYLKPYLFPEAYCLHYLGYVCEVDVVVKISDGRVSAGLNF